MQSKFKEYFDAVKYIESLINIPIDQDYMSVREDPDVFLERTKHFLSLLGDPHKRDTKYIHVTGTSGKGTVTNMIHSVLHEAGFNVGLFNSPYTTTSIEKIKVGDLYISPDEFVEIVNELKPHINHMYNDSPYGEVPYFEIFMAIAFLYFKRKNCDYVVLEVGMGGRYCATNVIETAVASVITNISLDHTHILGDTEEEIAYEKAGIIKEGTEFFTAETRENITKIFRTETEKYDVNYNTVNVQDNENKDIVRAVCKFLKIDEETIEKGIESTKVPCRLELVQHNPRVIIDGAHNEAKMKYLADYISTLNYEKLHLILGVKNNKKVNDILKSIIPLTDKLYSTRFQLLGYYKGFDVTHPKRLSEEAQKYKKDLAVELELDANLAVERAIAEANENDLILITGSLYLCGDVRKRWVSEEEILETRKSIVN